MLLGKANLKKQEDGSNGIRELFTDPRMMYVEWYDRRALQPEARVEPFLTQLCSQTLSTRRRVDP